MIWKPRAIDSSVTDSKVFSLLNKVLFLKSLLWKIYIHWNCTGLLISIFFYNKWQFNCLNYVSYHSFLSLKWAFSVLWILSSTRYLSIAWAPGIEGPWKENKHRINLIVPIYFTTFNIYFVKQFLITKKSAFIILEAKDSICQNNLTRKLIYMSGKQEKWTII